MHVISVAISLRCNCVTVNWVDFWIARKWKKGKRDEPNGRHDFGPKTVEIDRFNNVIRDIGFCRNVNLYCVHPEGAHKQSRPFRKCRARSEIYIEPVAYV